MTDGMPWLLLSIAIISYGIWIPLLGYYGDDWSYIWLSFKVHDLAHFFEGNRPNLVYFYNIINPILGPTPWHWHLFIFVLRWFTILAFWWLLSSIWGKDNRVVQSAALLFAVYPGFFLQANAVTFSIVFFFLTVFILSFIPLILCHPLSPLSYSANNSGYGVVVYQSNWIRIFLFSGITKTTNNLAGGKSICRIFWPC